MDTTQTLMWEPLTLFFLPIAHFEQALKTLKIGDEIMLFWRASLQSRK